VTHETEEDATEAPSDELSPKTLGQLLREARDKKQISLEKVAEELRIDLGVLQALESDRIAELPAAPVFIKGYIKHYGRQLGLDYAPLFDAYQRQVSRDDIDLRPNRSIALRDERQITAWIVAGLVLALILVFLFVWWIGEREATSALDPRSPAIAPAPASTTPAVSLPVTSAVPANETVANETVRALPSPPPSAGIAANPSDAGRAEASEGEPRRESADASVSATLVSETSSNAIIPEQRAERSIALRMTFESESWVEVTDARGEQLMYDLAAAGTAVELYPVPPVRVLLGNAEGVAVTVEGRAFAIPAQGRRANLANFVIRSAQD
jgi:cytoskeleton protein RodZ